MFEKYKLEDLFLASISVRYPESNIWEVNAGNLFMTQCIGYGYVTVLTRQNGKFIDLEDKSRNITIKRNPRETSYTIDFIEPFSKYYIKNGKTTFSKSQALKEAQKYYNLFHQQHLAQNENPKVKIKDM